MTERDQFAMAALAMFSAHWNDYAEIESAFFAQLAYEVADAMIEERDKRGSRP
jgi:hypothetical protein